MLALVIAMGLAGAAGQTPPPKPAVKPARYLKLPDASTIRAAYPAQAKGAAGQATIVCVIGLDTRLTDCKVVSESPAGRGFGAAALSLAPYVRVQPAEVDGAPQQGGTLTLPFRFGRP